MIGTSRAPGARDADRAPASRRGDLAELGIDPDDLPDGLVIADRTAG